MAPVGCLVPAAATADHQAAHPIAARDGGSTTEGKADAGFGVRCGEQQFQAGHDFMVTLVPCVTLSKSFHLLIFSDISKMELTLVNWVSL